MNPITLYRRAWDAVTYSCTVWCPRCKNDLTRDPDTKCIDDVLVRYTCGKCHFSSEWDFDTPSPVYIRPVTWYNEYVMTNGTTVARIGFAAGEDGALDTIRCTSVLPLGHPMRDIGGPVCGTQVPLTELPVMCPTCGARVM